MTKFHINDKGEAKECRAKEGNCPITKETGEPHYNSIEEAQTAYEKHQSKRAINTVSKNQNSNSTSENNEQSKTPRQNLLTEKERIKKMRKRFKQAEYERINLFENLEEINKKLVEKEEAEAKWTMRSLDEYVNLLARQTRVSLALLEITKQKRQVAKRIDENVDVEIADATLFLQKTREDEISKLVELREKFEKQQNSTIRKMFNSKHSQRDRRAKIIELGFRIKESFQDKAVWERYDQKQKDYIAFFKSVEPFLNDDEKDLVKKLRGRKNIQKEIQEELEELRAQPYYTSMDL